MKFSVNKNKPSYKITAIVSVYKAERFLRACLEDLAAQTIFDQTEVIIIDAHSPENEQAIVHEFIKKYQNIKYIRTDEREGLYTSWNRALSIASGEYITNANADDRHAKNAFERLSQELDKHPDVAVVYANCRITHEENACFYSAPIADYFRWLAYDHINLLRRCEVGPQPMWRRSMHETLGLFDDTYTITGDYDMWLRASEHYPLRHIPEELGLYLRYDNNLETQNQAHTQQEYLKVQSAALKRFMADDFKPHIPLDIQLNTHKERLKRYLCNLENGNNIKNRHKLGYHIYAYILLQTKLYGQTSLLDINKDISNFTASDIANYINSLLIKTPASF